MRLSLGSDLFRADLPEREIGKLGVNRLRQIRADIRIVVAPALQQFHERLMDNRPLRVAAVGAEGAMRRSGYCLTQYSALLMSVMFSGLSGSTITTLIGDVRRRNASDG